MAPTSLTYTDLSPLAKHEAAHALHGFLVGHKVERIKVTSDAAHTTLVYPVTPARLPALFQTDPLRWSVELQKVIGTITAGPLAEGVTPYGRDLTSLEQWKEAYRQCGAEESDWLALTAAVQRALFGWQRRESVGRAVASLAQMLLHAHIAEEFCIQFMLAEVGVEHIPEPYYEPIALSNKRWPGSSAVAVGVRKPAAAQAAAPGQTRLFTPEDEGWVWDDRAQNGHGGWVK
jgi:hypothetical protein